MKKAHELLADKLQKMIDSDQISTLPSRKKLAIHFGVSEMTVARAATLLRERGVLEFTRGQAMRVARTIPTALPKSSAASVQNLYRKLKSMISNAELQAGSSLPKIDRFVIEDRLTNRTVAKAYNLLVEHNYAYRMGKFWIVGQPAVSASRSFNSSDAPVILVIGNRPAAWGSLWTRRTERFAFTFLSEAERFGIRIHFVFTQEGNTGIEMPPMDLKQVDILIRNFGSRYSGALIASSWVEMANMPQWIQFLCKKRKPVVWIDRINERSTIAPRPQNFTRCYFSEQAAVQLACRYLAHHGHRKIGYLMHGMVDWELNRLNLIEQELKILGSDFSVTVNPAAKDFESSVRAFLRKANVSALIVPNDNTANHIYGLLQSRKISVPSDISILSFDNYPEYSALPVTTIDFGFGYLGYCAFHTIFGDVPIARGTNGFIQSKPRIVERGSVIMKRK